MTPATIAEIGQQAMIVTAQLCGPFLLAILLAGLVIAIFQAATQINEMTLSFVPKLIVVGVLLLVAGHWMLGALIRYTEDLIRSIPELIG